MLRKPNDLNDLNDLTIIDLIVKNSVFCVNGKPVNWIKSDDLNDDNNDNDKAQLNMRFGASTWKNFHLDLDRLWDETLNEYVSFG